MLRPDDYDFLGRLSDEIYEAEGYRISRSDILAAGIHGVRELHKLKKEHPTLPEFKACKSGVELSLVVVEAVRRAAADTAQA